MSATANNTLQYSVAAAVLLFTFACCSRVQLKPNPSRPSNPDVWLNTRRPETTYHGPLHQFESRLKIQDSVLKLILPSGYKECFYYVLLEGFQLHLYISTISSNDPHDVFDVFISDGYGHHLMSYIFKTSVSHNLNVTENDTYEVCVYNPVAEKKISYSSYYYMTHSFTKALEDLAALNNVSVEVESSIEKMEISIGQALNEIRNKPYLSRDYNILQDTNAYIQWKSIFYICIMLCSFIGTTIFIRRLFSGSRSTV